MKYFATLFLSAALFVACSGESGDPIAPDLNGKTSSSSVESGNVSSSSAKSSSSVTPKSSSSSVTQGPGTSSGINSVEGSSSSRLTEILEPEITVNETCTEVGACDAMVKTDVSSWHFVRKDAFGDDAEYIYRADGRDLIVTIKNADGSIDSKTYSMYNMESEAGVEMAFNAAKSTCRDGGGNDNKRKNCVTDTTFALPRCDKSLEGFVGKEDSSSYVSCKSGSWVKATDLEVKLKFACVKDLQGEMRFTSDSVLYKCNSQKWEEVYIPEKGILVDDRDGQTYKTVKIGNQWWMAENLNFNADFSFCYNDSAEYCEKYGRLYMWSAAMDSAGVWSTNGKECGYGKLCTPTYPVRGVCPDGWHLPSKDEWVTLSFAVGERSSAGTKLKSTSGWNNSGNGSDDFGFSALPAGYSAFEVGHIGLDAVYLAEGELTIFWASTSSTYDYASDMNLLDKYGSLDLSTDDTKYSGFSVRCLKDDP